MEEQETVAVAPKQETFKGKVKRILKILGDKTYVKNSVEKITEFLLPYSFWIGLFIILYRNIVITFVGADWAGKVFKVYSSVTEKIEYFVLNIITEVGILLIAYFLIYLLIEIRNSLQQHSS